MVLCSISIFLIVPVARFIQRFVSNNWGRALFGYFVLVVLFIGFTILLFYLITKLKIRAASNYIWLFIVAGLYIYFTLKLWKVPEETVHFLEYGLLGFFLFKSLSHHVRDKSIFITATFFALFIGTLDEILQWITPQRYWDFRDAGLNCLSGGLFQLAIWKVVKPKIISEKINTKSFRILTSIIASCLIILGLCASNTPRRVANYTKKIPWLSFLQKEEPMNEFGYKHKDPEIGVFYSRLSHKTLQDVDNLRGKQNAQILNRYIDTDYYGFLRVYNTVNDPFMYELRVHVYRRDTYFEKGKSASGLSKKKEFYFIAYKENLILEKYFGQSIENSIYRWNNDFIQESEALIDKSKPYDSSVSSNIITSFSEKTMWISVLALISLLVIVNFTTALIKKRKNISAFDSRN